MTHQLRRNHLNRFLCLTMKIVDPQVIHFRVQPFFQSSIILSAKWSRDTKKPLLTVRYKKHGNLLVPKRVEIFSFRRIVIPGVSVTHTIFMKKISQNLFTTIYTSTFRTKLFSFRVFFEIFDEQFFQAFMILCLRFLFYMFNVPPVKIITPLH